MTEDDQKPFTYAEPEVVPEGPAREIIRLVEENDPMKPWTLISRLETDMDHDVVRIKVLKPLVLEGVLSPNADGYICVYKKERLENII